MTERLFKVLNEDGSARMGIGSWPLPKDREPGEWIKVEGDLVPCKNGLHLARKPDLIRWIGPAIFEAEYRGERVNAPDKIVVREARLLRNLNTWNETTARLFAADCAKYAIRICEKNRIKIDQRVKESIKVVYRYARGEASEAEISAAESAAWAAAAAAKSAAWAAAAESAAWAAESAAAAKSAAWAAAAKSWQTRRLFEYLDGKRS